MKLVALTYGTEGDTRPIAALCRALMDTGHETTLLADAGTLGSARDLGVPHAALAGDIRGMLQTRIEKIRTRRASSLYICSTQGPRFHCSFR